MKTYFVYIATNKRDNVLYTGMTSDLPKRIEEHKQKLVKGFTQKYNINKLVYFEELPTALDALSAERKIKGWARIKKINLIKSINPDFQDLSLDF